MISREECKNILRKIGYRLDVSPKLIAERLLSTEDKEDMLSGLLTQNMIELAVKDWKNAGMPDYANGLDKPYKNNY